MLGKTHGKIDAICPLQDGVISNYDITEKMLRYFIMKVYSRRPLIRPRIVICIPSCVTQVEKRAVRESAIQAGAREVYVVEEPMAAAIGAGLPVHEPAGNMVIDIGGGTTEVAIISLYGIVYSQSVRIGGNKMDAGIADYIKTKYKLRIGIPFAEQIKMHIGTAYPPEEIVNMEIKGGDIVSGLPTIREISNEEIRVALQDSVNKIVEAVKLALESITPEHAADIVDRGIVLTGGGALLRNLDKRLKEDTGLPIIVSDDPLTAVVMGLGKVLENADLLKKVTVD